MELLMLGSGDPSQLNSGIGIACDHIAKSIGQKVALTLVTPQSAEEMADELVPQENKLQIPVSPTLQNKAALQADIVHISVKSAINPYVYFDGAAEATSQESRQTNDTVKDALEAFTTGVVQTSADLRFDVIYGHDWMSINAGIKLKEKSNKPLVLHIHTLDYDRIGKKSNSWLFNLEQKGMMAADKVIAVSQYHADIMQQVYGIAADKIEVIHHGLDKIIPLDYQKPFNEKLVVFAGRFSMQKGAAVFVKAAKKLMKDDRNIRFVMAGSGEQFSSILSDCVEAEMLDRVHFTGHLDQSQLFSLMQVADVFVMPSQSDPFGLSALEAAAIGVPVIVSENCGVKEVLPEAEVVKHDADSYKQGILKMLNTPGDAKRKAEVNKEAVKQRTWDKVTDELVLLFNEFA